MLTFPFATDHQLVTDMANSARDVAALVDRGSRGQLNSIHGQRIHELMRYRSHTVNTDGF